MALVSALATAVILCQTPERAAPRRVDPLVLLVHPCPYEGMGRPENDPYRALERAACQRWLDAIATLPPSTFVVEIAFTVAGPSVPKLDSAFIKRLGKGRLCHIPVEVQSPDNPGPLREYYGRILARIRRQMADEGLTFNPATCRTIIWGQSFEGCASGFGSALASGLGMKTLTQLDYAMSAPDAPFLLRARFLQTQPVPGSDVEAYLFNLADGRFAAFFRSRLTPQWLDHRPISLRLDPARFQALSKQGAVVWPTGTPPSGPQPVTLSTVQERFVVGRSVDELKNIIGSAVVRQYSSITSRRWRMESCFWPGRRRCRLEKVSRAVVTTEALSWMPVTFAASGGSTDASNDTQTCITSYHCRPRYPPPCR